MLQRGEGLYVALDFDIAEANGAVAHDSDCVRGLLGFGIESRRDESPHGVVQTVEAGFKTHVLILYNEVEQGGGAWRLADDLAPLQVVLADIAREIAIACWCKSRVGPGKAAALADVDPFARLSS